MKINALRAKVGKRIVPKGGSISLPFPEELTTQTLRADSNFDVVVSVKNFAYIDGEFMEIEEHEFVQWKKKRVKKSELNK